MKPVKIIFIDVDGTLIDMRKKQITPRILETLSALQARGIRVCVATGRSPMQVPRLPGVEFDTFLTYNGSCCYDRQQEIFSNPLPREDVYTIIRNAAKLGRPLSLATKSRLASNGADQDLIEYYGFAGISVEIAPDFDQVAAHDQIYQIMMGGCEQEYAAILDGVKGARIAAWWDRAVDIIPAAGGKGAAIRKILAHYHLSAADAMAFGDGNNDIEMLEAVGTGVAMQNASPALKAVADDVCGDVCENGIWTYCRAHGLIP